MIQRKPNLNKISFVGHSVGGLVARYAIGKLYRTKTKTGEDSPTNESEENLRGTICGLEAVNFITVATPHLGSRGNKQVVEYAMSTQFLVSLFVCVRVCSSVYSGNDFNLLLIGAVSFWCTCLRKIGKLCYSLDI